MPNTLQGRRFILYCPVCKNEFRGHDGRGIPEFGLIEGMHVCFGHETDPRKQHPVTPMDIKREVKR